MSFGFDYQLRFVSQNGEEHVKQVHDLLYTLYRLDLLCATGFLSMVAAVVFLIDLVLTIRFGMKGRFEY